MHWLGRFVTLAAVVVGLGTPWASAQVVEMIPNGSFDADLSGWTLDLGATVLDEATQARSKPRCVTAETTEPNRHGLLSRRITLVPGRLYEVEAWARATNNTKLVFWRSQGTERTMISAFENIKPRWQRCLATFSVDKPGEYTLEFIVASSHGAPFGRMWVDDIAMREYTTARFGEISGGLGYNDFPVVTSTQDGSLWAAWVSFRDNHDTLQVARGHLEGDDVKIDRTWQVEGGPMTYLLDPCLASDGTSVWLAYSSEREGNWEVYANRLGDQGPGTALCLSRDPAVDIKPALTVLGDRVWAAWESNRDAGMRQIYLCTITGDEVGRAQRLSSGGSDNYAPTIAAVSPEDLWVVWHSFRDNNMDLFGRHRTAEGPGNEIRLTQASIIDREAKLGAHNGQFWLTWDTANPAGYHIGAAATKRVQIAQITPRGLQTPLGIEKTLLQEKAEAGDFAFDSNGRLWVAAQTPRPKSGFVVSPLCYAGTVWTGELRMSTQKGLCRRPNLVMLKDRPVVIYQADTTPGSWATVEDSQTGLSGIYASALNTTQVPSASAMTLAPYLEPVEVFEAGTIRQARGEDLPGTSIDYDGQRLNLYFGDLHNHTDISICNRVGDQTQVQAYQSMRDIARHDFAACTDHGYNINAYLWNYLAKIARANNDPGRFLTFLAEEWTSSFEKYDDPKRPYGYYGHRNLILGDPYFPFWLNERDGKTPAEVWEILRKAKADFVHIPHQLADTGNVPTDWSFVDEKAQPVAEIFQTRGSYEYEGTPRQAKNSTPKGWFLQDAWAQGVVIGVIASPDHGGGMGKAAVYAPELSRKAILEAIRQRHTYGTTAAKIALDVRVKGRLMGEKLSASDGTPVKVEIHATCPGDIDRVDVCRSNVFVYTPQVQGKECNITYLDNQPPKGPCYYYVRVIQKDGEIAWSSPVWLGSNGPI
jgi:hypothetical protein